MLNDVRYAVRQLLRAPAFAVTAILTLALGTGANTAVVGLIGSFTRPLPVPDAQQLMVLAAATPGDETGFRFNFSHPAIVDLRSSPDVFSDVFGFQTSLGGLTVRGVTSQFVYQAVTGNFFSGLQLTPSAGRFFSAPAGEQSDVPLVVVLGYNYWRSRFGGDPAVIDSTVLIDGQAARVIGIAPKGFRGVYEGTEMDGYLPFGGLRGRVQPSSELFIDRENRWLTVMARLRPGVSIAAAQSAMDGVASRMSARFPRTDGHIGVRVVPETLARPVPLRFLERILPMIKAALFVLSSLVLAIACMNVTNLLLVRATARQREMAVRASLGSGRGRLIRLLLAESLVLALAGSAVGALMAKWAMDLLVQSIDFGISVPVAFDTSLDLRGFAYALAVAMGTGVIMGVLPALRASRASLTDLLHDGSRGESGGVARQRVRRALVVAQVAGSLVLLVVAGLFVKNLRSAQSLDVGFDPRQVLNARLDPGQIGYDRMRTKTFYDELTRRLTAEPGVENVTMAFSAPLGFIFLGTTIHPQGVLPRTDEPPAVIGFNSVSPSYFTTMRLPIVKGRAFTEQDILGSQRVVVVNETLATRLWPGQDPIGKRVVTPRIDDDVWEVVGVARDSKYVVVFEDPLPYFYLSIEQNPMFMRVISLRSSIAPEALSAVVQHDVSSLDSSMPAADIHTMQQSIEGGMGFLLLRTGAMQAGALGILGLVLAIVGVYGIVSYSASQRTREFGIRLALGAQAGDVRRLVLWQGAGLVLAGVGGGLIITFAVTRVLARLLYQVSTTDPLTFVVVTLLLAGVALVACFLPAHRATRIDPSSALRYE